MERVKNSGKSNPKQTKSNKKASSIIDALQADIVFVG